MLLGYQLKQTQQILVSTKSVNDESYTPGLKRIALYHVYSFDEPSRNLNKKSNV